MLSSLVQNGYSQLYPDSVYYRDMVFERGDSLLGDEEKSRVFGDVIFRHKDVRFRSDSAYHYEKRGEFHGFSRVKITQGDSVELTGDTLYYYEQKELAEVFGNVVFKDKETTLYTDHLLYDTKLKQAYYYEDGRVLDGENVLTSLKGTYAVNTKTYHFKTNVKINNPTYILLADTLDYNSLSSIAYFTGPTHIYTADKHLYAEDGEYHSIPKLSYFNDNAVVETETYILKGDSLYYDEQFDNGIATQHVVMISKTDSLAIFGQKAYRWGSLGYSKVYDEALCLHFAGTDTLFLEADTLVAIDDSTSINDYILAYDSANFYRSDMQGVCDSLVYDVADSIIYLNFDPVMWNTSNQITADSLFIKLNGDDIERMYARKNSFAISQDSLGLFNQMQGRDMTTYFKNSNVDRIEVEGNAENIYYSLDGDSVLTGMNRVKSSNTTIWFLNGEMHKIKYDYEPEGLYIPPSELTPEVERLSGYVWRIEEKPIRKNYSFNKPLLDLMPAEYYKYSKELTILPK
ncbi:MAG: OstA-like protein [Cyclobacteriaceae bacterium]